MLSRKYEASEWESRELEHLATLRERGVRFGWLV